MKKVLSIIACVALMALAAASVANACWIYLTVEELFEQSELIVIGELTGDIRELVRKDGSGVTFWEIEVEHVIKGESGPLLEVATGGLVSREGKQQLVMLSTDYRLDSYGELFLLCLSKQGEDSYSPLTPRGIVTLERSEGGSLLDTYDIISEQHAEEITEVIDTVNRQPVAPPRAIEEGVVWVTEEDGESTPKTPAIVVALAIFAIVVFAIKKQ